MHNTKEKMFLVLLEILPKLKNFTLQSKIRKDKK
jgi:hypothetical protein